MEQDNYLKGRRCIASVRCSTKRQKGESFPQQASWLRDFADENEIKYVGEIRTALGVSQTENRPDIDYLLNRAATDKDYDTVLVQDMSRLTRGGIEHGLKLYFLFKEVGVLICTITDGLIDGPDKLKEAIKRFEEAQAQSNQNTLNMMRGKLKRRREGKLLYTANIPYGLDRLFTSADGQPLHIIRNLSDGSQVQLDPSGQTVIRTYEANSDGNCNHYQKQRDEQVTLIPGAPEHVEIVKRIFHKHFVDGITMHTLAKDLNNGNIRARNGGPWTECSIRGILENSIYFGVGVANRQTKAIFYKCGKLTPQPIAVSQHSKKSEAKKEPLAHFRPEIDWYEQIFPQLGNLPCLDEVTKERVKKCQKENRRRLAARIAKKRGGDRYPESDYILKGVLYAKQEDRKMSGCIVRPDRKNRREYRYYRVTAGTKQPKDNNILTKMVPADMLEDAAMKVLREATSSFTETDSVVSSVIAEEALAVAKDGIDINHLKSELEATLRQIDFYVHHMRTLGDVAVAVKTEPYRKQMLDLQSRIEAAERQKPTSIIDVEQITGNVRKHCAQIVNSLDGLTRLQIRHLLKTLIKKMTVDLQTRETVLEVHMPSWIATNASDVVTDVCAENGTSRCDIFGANKDWSIPLATFTCVARRKKKQFCMDCTRLSRIPQTSNMPLAA